MATHVGQPLLFLTFGAALLVTRAAALSNREILGQLYVCHYATLLEFGPLDFIYLQHRYVSTGGDNEWTQDDLAGWPEHAVEDNDPCQEEVCHFLALPTNCKPLD
jgi:hypothetical protein